MAGEVVTIIPAPPFGLVGPGIDIDIQVSGVIPPIQTGDQWRIWGYADTDKTQQVFQQFFTVTNFNQALPLGKGLLAPSVSGLYSDYTLKEGDPITIEAQYRRPGLTPTPSTTITATWSKINLDQWIRWFFQDNPAGMSSSQAAQLTTVESNTNTQQTQWTEYTTVTLPSMQDVLNNIIASTSAVVQTAAGAIGMTLGEIFSGKTLDQIGSDEVTSGPTCDPIDWSPTPGTVLFGIFIHCTSIPDWYAFTAPGGGWTQRDLAVIQVFRDEEVLWRQGIHTPTYMLYPMPGEPELPLRLNVPVTPPEYRVTVDWGTGICGQLWGMTLP